ISTVKLPIKYKPEADCPKIKKFLSEILAEDDIPIIQELFGYALLKDYHIQKAFMFVGEGANGKSTLLALFKSFLGSKNVSSIALQDLETNRFASSALYDKLANIYADLTDRAMHQTGKFKMLTGGDIIPSEKKFKDSFSFVNYAKLIFSANKLPETRDDTSAFFRRWAIINFPNVFEGDKADPKILEKLTTEEELSGIFNWSVEGLKRLLQNGCFSYSKTTEDVRDLYERMASPLLAFIKDRIELDPKSYILKDHFYSEFVNYCKENKLPTKAKNVIGLELPRYIPSIKSERKRLENERVYAWVGIRLIEKNAEIIEKHLDHPDHLNQNSAEPVQAVQVVQAFSYFKSNGSNDYKDSIDKIKIEKNIDRLGHLGQKRASELESWLINHFKNYKGIPKTFFVNDALKMFPSADPESIQDFYEFLVDANKLLKFIQERKKIRETDTYRDLKFAPDYNQKLLLFLVSQKEVIIEKDPSPWKGEWYVDATVSVSEVED
ncbi:MAG: phage/plasmid primase, P4 family, partial [Candidatus Thermoplasmatota archaeon]